MRLDSTYEQTPEMFLNLTHAPKMPRLVQKKPLKLQNQINIKSKNRRKHRKWELLLYSNDDNNEEVDKKEEEEEEKEEEEKEEEEEEEEQEEEEEENSFVSLRVTLRFGTGVPHCVNDAIALRTVNHPKESQKKSQKIPTR